MACLKKCHSVSIAILFLLGALASLASSRTIPREVMLQKHEQWMAQHRRAYKDAEEKAQRFNIFKKNVEYIESSNQDTSKSYKLAVNAFADLTTEEFNARFGFKKRALQEIGTLESAPFRYGNVTNLPSNVDWRQKGAVLPDVRVQGKCGCGWAISAVQTVEAITKFRTGKLIALSAQQVVDCDTMSSACTGGLATNAFKYIIQNHGVTTKLNYPFRGINGTCDKKKAAHHAATIRGFAEVPRSETALLQAVANQPVAAMIDASGDDFRFYKKGVFTGKCDTVPKGGHWHAVTIIGYGTTSNGIKYWLAKNSVGSGWGEGGYIRLQRDIGTPDGLCGIAARASYPIA